MISLNLLWNYPNLTLLSIFLVPLVCYNSDYNLCLFPLIIFVYFSAYYNDGLSEDLPFAIIPSSLIPVAFFHVDPLPLL